MTEPANAVPAEDGGPWGNVHETKKFSFGLGWAIENRDARRYIDNFETEDEARAVADLLNRRAQEAPDAR